MHRIIIAQLLIMQLSYESFITVNKHYIIFMVINCYCWKVTLIMASFCFIKNNVTSTWLHNYIQKILHDLQGHYFYWKDAKHINCLTLVKLNECLGISKYWQLDCLFNSCPRQLAGSLLLAFWEVHPTEDKKLNFKKVLIIYGLWSLIKWWVLCGFFYKVWSNRNRDSLRYLMSGWHMLPTQVHWSSRDQTHNQQTNA